MPSTTITLEPKVRIEPRDVSGEDKVAATMEVCRAQKRDEVANTNASYSDSDWTFELANTWGACVQWREVRVRIAGQAVAGEGDRREAASDFRDGTTGWELVKALDLAEVGGGIAGDAVEMLGAAKPPAGLMTIVTDPGVSGLLAHEVMGHASEGDEIVKKRSFLTDQVGKKVGSPLVSMYDDGTYPGAHGSIPFDAEGTPAHKTTVIDRGVYRGFLHSLETSGMLKARPTGNGRAQDFGRRPTVHAMPGRRRRRLTWTGSTSRRTRCDARGPRAPTPRRRTRSLSPRGPSTSRTTSRRSRRIGARAASACVRRRRSASRSRRRPWPRPRTSARRWPRQWPV